MKTLVLGASSGFGREFAFQLANRKHELVICSNDIHGLDLVKNEIQNKCGIPVEIFEGDLTCTGVIDEIFERYKDIDLLINSAGAGIIGDIFDIPLEREQQIIELNINALYRLTKKYALHMAKRGTGGIINVASTSSYIPMPNFGIYAATKAFALSYTLAVSREVQGCGVKVMAVCPGPTETNFLSKEHYQKIRNKLFNLPVLMSPEKVVRKALSKYDKNRRVYIPGVLNKIINISDRFLPMGVILNSVYKLYDYVKKD